MTGSALTLQNITLYLHDRVVLSIDAHVEAGSVLSIMGPSGCGKSSLLAFIAGFLSPDFKTSGSVLMGGQDVRLIKPHSRRFGMLFQDALLFPHMSVGRNLMFAIPRQVRGKGQRIELAQDMLKQIELSAFFDSDPALLSGGQKTRIALARTLLSQPRALLLDEPFSKLDANLRASMRDLVFTNAEKLMLPVVLVTHDVMDVKGEIIEIKKTA
jgi:putative thiamine transport system ATP-binding protein